jgi:formylglycine-generating enzyme required for sulfatase activity
MKKNVISIIALLAMTMGATAQTMETFTVNGVPFKMVKVEGGTFKMGATPDQGEVLASEPVREATVGTFFIGETEVTQGLWKAVMGTSPSVFKHPLSEFTKYYPVENVSWQDCKEFIQKLNKLTNRKFRLPTEEEWEYAARGGKKAKATRFAGSNNIEDVAWYAQNSGKKHLGKDFSGFEIRENECKTHMVAEKVPNELGIYDMTGNVAEITNTKYTRSKSKSEHGKYIVKGGGYSSRVNQCVIADIGVISPKDKLSEWGFRLALSE